MDLWIYIYIINSTRVVNKKNTRTLFQHIRKVISLITKLQKINVMFFLYRLYLQNSLACIYSQSSKN